MKLDEIWRSIGYPSALESEYINSTLYELSQAKEKSGHAALVFAKAHFDREEYEQCKGELVALAAHLEKDTDHVYAAYDTVLYCRVLTLCGHFNVLADAGLPVSVGAAQAYYLRAMLVADYPVAIRALLALSPALSDGILEKDAFTLQDVAYTKKSYATVLCNNAGVGCYLAMLLFMQAKEKSAWVCIAAELALLNSYLLTEDELVEVWYMLALNKGMDLLAGEFATKVTLASLLSTKPPFNPTKYCAGVLLENGSVETIQMRLKEGRPLCAEGQLQAIERFCADKERRKKQMERHKEELERRKEERRLEQEAEAVRKLEEEVSRAQMLALEIERRKEQSRLDKEAEAARQLEQEMSRASELARKIEEKEVREQQVKEDAMRCERNLLHVKERAEVASRKREKREAQKLQRDKAQDAIAAHSIRKKQLLDVGCVLIVLVLAIPLLLLFGQSVIAGVSMFISMWIALGVFMIMARLFMGVSFSDSTGCVNGIAITIAVIVTVLSAIGVIGECITNGVFTMLRAYVTGGLSSYLSNGYTLCGKTVQGLIELF